jgi:hypothetical protein
MREMYQKLQNEFKIGPFVKDPISGTVMSKPFQEYPKWVYLPDGTTKIVHSQREEMAVTLSYGTDVERDPVIEERDRLIDMVAERDAKAEADAKAMAAAQREIEGMRALLAERAKAAEVQPKVDAKGR